MSRVSGTVNLPSQHTLTKKKSGIIRILPQSLKGKETFGKTETAQRPLRKAGCRQNGCMFLNIKKDTAHGPQQTYCRSHIYGQINKIISINMDSVQHRLFQKLSCCQDEEEMWTGLLAWCLRKFFPTYLKAACPNNWIGYHPLGISQLPLWSEPRDSERRARNIWGSGLEPPRQLLSARATQAY